MIGIPTDTKFDQADLGANVKGDVHDHGGNGSVVWGANGICILAHFVHDDVGDCSPVPLKLHVDGARDDLGMAKGRSVSSSAPRGAGHDGRSHSTANETGAPTRAWQLVASGRQTGRQ